MASQFSNYPNGFANGVSIRGIPLVQTHPGKVFWVDNSTPGNGDFYTNGSDGNAGTFRQPFATLQKAVTTARANKGDIIFVKPGHAETVSAAGGLVLSTAGIAIVGLGMGANRPTITLDTANTATITVTANNVTVSNFLFKANFLNIATCFAIANAQVATDFTVDSSEFRDNSVILNFVSVVKVGTTANIADGLTFTNNKVLAAILTTVPANQTAIVTASIIDRLNVSKNTVIYPKLLNDTACLLAAGALDLTNAVIDGNYVFRPDTSTTGGHMISSSSTASSGFVSNNLDAHLDNSAGLMIATGTKFAFFRNFSMITGAADKSALENPVAV
jgi:hypothetical protein